MVKGFPKMYNFSFLGKKFFCKHFHYITGFCDKKFKFANFLQILKVEHKSFPMMYHLSYLDIKHGIKRGGGQIDPPQHILVFKYPSRDRVNFKQIIQILQPKVINYFLTHSYIFDIS